MNWPKLEFSSLRTKLGALYVALFAIGFLAISVVGQAMIESQARHSVESELLASGTVYDRLWELREHTLVSSADVLARDFWFSHRGRQRRSGNYSVGTRQSSYACRRPACGVGFARRSGDRS